MGYNSLNKLFFFLFIFIFSSLLSQNNIPAGFSTRNKKAGFANYDNEIKQDGIIIGTVLFQDATSAGQMMQVYNLREKLIAKIYISNPDSYNNVKVEVNTYDKKYKSFDDMKSNYNKNLGFRWLCDNGYFDDGIAETPVTANSNPVAASPPAPSVPNEKITTTQSTSYFSQLTEKLKSMKEEAVKADDFEKAAEIKKELDLRDQEDKNIVQLQNELDSKIKAEDYEGAAKDKEELKRRKDTKEKKETLRNNIVTYIAAEDYANAAMAKKELEVLCGGKSPGTVSKPKATQQQPPNRQEEHIESCSSCSVRLATAQQNSLFVKSDGTVWGWGSNKNEQLGQNIKDESAAPVQIKGLSDCIAVSIGPEPWHGAIHCLALKSDGTVWGWGNNKKGQLGSGSNISESMPVKINELSGITAIRCAWGFSLFLKNDGTVWAMGNNNNGQLGNGTNNDSNIPVKVNNLQDVIAISTEDRSSFALKKDGTVWAWGFNMKGILGNGNESSTNVPVKVNGFSDIISIACGGFHCLGLKNDGTVWALGINSEGQLGDGTKKDKSIAVQVNGLTDVAGIAGGERYSIAMKNDGTVWAWGANEQGQLGDSSVSWHEAFTQTMAKSGNVVGGVLDNGGKGVNSNVPVKVSGLTNVVGISAGIYHAMALKKDGSVWTWGANNNGQLGIDKPPFYTNTPKKVYSVSPH